MDDVVSPVNAGVSANPLNHAGRGMLPATLAANAHMKGLSMHRSRSRRFFEVLRVVIPAVLITLATTGWPARTGSARAIDAEAALPAAAHGTPFHFEVIESNDAKYLGDTPAHRGKDGGLAVRPQVALGDAVYRKVGGAQVTIGRITRIEWNRVSGSLDLKQANAE